MAGAQYGWNQGIANRTTIDDLLGSGKLGIIATPEIRASISKYYTYYQRDDRRIEERETIYPNLTYQFVPRGGIRNRGLEPGLTDEQLSQIVEEVLESPIKDHVTAEINFARFILLVSADLQQQAMDLSEILKNYQKEIQD